MKKWHGRKLICWNSSSTTLTEKMKSIIRCIFISINMCPNFMHFRQKISFKSALEIFNPVSGHSRIVLNHLPWEYLTILTHCKFLCTEKHGSIRKFYEYNTYYVYSAPPRSSNTLSAKWKLAEMHFFNLSNLYIFCGVHTIYFII